MEEFTLLRSGDGEFVDTGKSSATSHTLGQQNKRLSPTRAFIEVAGPTRSKCSAVAGLNRRGSRLLAGQGQQRQRLDATGSRSHPKRMASH